MGEISAVAAARAAVLRNEAETIRDRQQRAQERLDDIRQTEIDRGAFDVQQLGQRRQARFETLRDETRSDEEDERFFESQRQSRATQVRDDAFAITQRRIQEEIFRADQLNQRFEEPVLTPRQIVGSQRSPEEIEIARQLAAPPDPEPPVAAPVAFDDRPPAPEPLGPPPLETAVAALPPPDAPPPAPPAGADDAAFLAAERDRLARVAERRGEDRDFDVRQDVDLRRAGERIAQAAADPGLPRGSVVDVFG